MGSGLRGPQKISPLAFTGHGGAQEALSSWLHPDLGGCSPLGPIPPTLATPPHGNWARAGEGMSPTQPTCPRVLGSCRPGDTPKTEDQQVVGRALH